MAQQNLIYSHCLVGDISIKQENVTQFENIICT